MRGRGGGPRTQKRQIISDFHVWEKEGGDQPGKDLIQKVEKHNKALFSKLQTSKPSLYLISTHQKEDNKSVEALFRGCDGVCV